MKNLIRESNSAPRILWLRLPAGYVPPLPPYLPRALVGKEGEETNRLSFCFFGGREGTGHRLTPEPEVKTVFSAPPIAKSPSPLPDWAVALGNALPPAGSDREALASVLKALASGLAVGTLRTPVAIPGRRGSLRTK